MASKVEFLLLCRHVDVKSTADLEKDYLLPKKEDFIDQFRRVRVCLGTLVKFSGLAVENSPAQPNPSAVRYIAI